MDGDELSGALDMTHTFVRAARLNGLPHLSPITRRASAARHRLAPVLLALLAATGAGSAQAQTWTGGVNPNPLSPFWNLGFNWQGGVVPVSNANTALTFTGTRQTATNQNLAAVFDLNAMTFANGAGAFSVSGNALRFVGSTASLTQNSANTATLVSAVQITDTLTVRGSGAVSFRGTLASGNANPSVRPVLSMKGTGRLTLNEVITFNGRVEIDSGVVQVDNPLGLQAAQVVLNTTNGLQFNTGGAATIGQLTGAGTGTLALGATRLTLRGSSNPGDLYIGGISATTGALVQEGPGTSSARFTGTSGVDRLQVKAGGVALDGGALALANTSEGLLVGDGTNAATTAATLLLGNGATLRSLGTTVQVDGFAGTRLDVTGAGSRLETGLQALVGNHATGALRVASGGTVTTGNFLLVGWDNNGRGTLEVQAGGTVNSAFGVVGGKTGGIGAATVSGTDAVWNTGQLSVGGFDESLRGGTGTVTVSNGGQISVAGALSFWTPASSVIVDGGRLSVTQLRSIGGVGNLVLQNDGPQGAALVLSPFAGTFTFEGSISGGGSLRKTRAGTQILAGTNSFTGAVQVAEGTLRMTNSAASDYEVSPGARLELGQSALGSAAVMVQTGGTAAYTGTLLTGGLLMGGGTHDLGAVRRVVGTGIANGTTLAPAGGTRFIGVNNAGLVSNDAGRSLTWSGGGNTTGTLRVAGSTSVSSFASGGQIEVLAGGTLANSASSLVLGGGSRTSVGTAAAPGGTIRLDGGTRLQLNGGLLVNNGSIEGPVEINFGGLAKGAGVYGAVTVGDGGRFSPGNSPGTVQTGSATWGAGGTYLIELASATGSAGTAWDLWAISGSLDITAGTSANSRFTLQVASLDGSGAGAPLAGFDPHRAWQWRIADTTAGVTGFDLARLSLDTRSFTSATAGGSFSVSLNGGDVYLNFAPVPEPASWALLLGGLAGLGAWARRQRSRAEATGSAQGA